MEKIILSPLNKQVYKNYIPKISFNQHNDNQYPIDSTSSVAYWISVIQHEFQNKHIVGYYRAGYYRGGYYRR